LIEQPWPIAAQMIHGATGAKMVSLHHDISTATGEEVVIFTLGESPTFRETKNNK
jgi:uncharacterized protein YbcI